MKLSVGAKIWTCLCGLMLVLLSVGGVSYVNTRQLQVTAALQTHTHVVLSTMTDLLSSLQDAETGQRGYVITGVPDYLAPYASGKQNSGPILDHLAALTADDPAAQRNIAALRPLIQEKFAELQQTIDLRTTQGEDAARNVVLTNRGKIYMDDIRAVIGQMQDEENALLVARDHAAAASVEATFTVIIGGALLASLLALAMGFFLSRSISRPLGDITCAAARIGTGDLNFALTLDKRTDEIGLLSRTFDTMVGNLRLLIQEIRGGTNVLGTASSQIVSITAQVAAGASETVAALAETSATMEEVRRTSQVSTEKALYVSETAQKTAQVSQGGKLAVEQSITGIGKVREQIGTIAEAVMRLSEQSQAIGEIVAAVNDLAEQSNLLAVNAAIEAARAGDQGKGFAVVAQEVKSLADQSKQATAQVRGILGDIQKATATVVLAAEQGSKAVDAGVKQSADAGEAIERLAESIVTTTQAATQIAAMNQQQQVGIDQIAGALENIRQASVQNMSATKQAETAAQNLNELGHKLKSVAGQYKA